MYMFMSREDAYWMKAALLAIAAGGPGVTQEDAKAAKAAADLVMVSQLFTHLHLLNLH